MSKYTKDERASNECPNCGRTGRVDARKEKKPKYRCKYCGTEFDEQGNVHETSNDEQDVQHGKHPHNYPACEDCGRKIRKKMIGTHYPHSYSAYASGREEIRCKKCGDHPWTTEWHNTGN